MDGPLGVVCPVSLVEGGVVGDVVGPLEGPPPGGTVVGPAVVEVGVGVGAVVDARGVDAPVPMSAAGAPPDVPVATGAGGRTHR